MPDFRVSSAYRPTGGQPRAIESLALAAYNAGQKNVDDWVAAGKDIDFPEPRQYVDEVLELEDVYRRAYEDELGVG